MGGGGARGPVAHPTIHSSRAGNRLSYTGGAPSSDSARLNFGGAIWRMASVAMTNTGARKIKSVRLKYVFTDPATGIEVLRIRHRSGKRLSPGQSYVYTKTLNSSKRTRRGDEARMSVEVREAVYAGGSVWTPGRGR